MKAFLFIFFQSLLFYSQAQVQISGIVETRSGRPVAGANVYIQGTYDGGSSDSLGRFGFETGEWLPLYHAAYAGLIMGFTGHDVPNKDLYWDKAPQLLDHAFRIAPDEAVDHLIALLRVYDKNIQISAIFDSVKDVVAWLQSNPPPDLFIMDIQVSDGLCFDIFGKVQVQSPVIFTTAYQEYAIRAFKVNSVDYLLKPIDFSGLDEPPIVSRDKVNEFKEWLDG